MRIALLRILIATLSALAVGCSTYRVAKSELDVGFHAAPDGAGRHVVRYNGESMESRAALERNLGRGVHTLCGGGYTLDDVRVDEALVMHRWQPHFRYVSAIATCGRAIE